MEAAVLGALWHHGPCTAYAIRKEFMESPSPRWSGSAGAVYPLLERMERIKLVRSNVNRRGKRKQRDYEISSKGLVVFRRWLRNLKPDLDVALMHDPLRSKLFFLDALTANQARTLVEEALDGLRNQLSSFQGYAEQNPIVGRNMLLVTQARIEWLKEVLKTMK